MQLLVYTVLAMVAFLVAYGFDLGSNVSALVFLAVLVVGIIHRTAKPIIASLRG